MQNMWMDVQTFKLQFCWNGVWIDYNSVGWNYITEVQQKGLSDLVFIHKSQVATVARQITMSPWVGACNF